MTAHPESLPYNGKRYKAKTKKFEETVLFVPFFDSEQKAMLRHVRFVNGLGFDAVTFDLHQTPAILNFSKGLATPLLKWRELKDTWKPPITPDLKFGLKHVYADQIENLLNLIPGKKIVFAFSNPAGAAIEALARRNAVDVSALVCDSGPSGKFVESFMNLAKYDWKINSTLVRFTMAPILSLAWSPHLHKDINADLDSLPSGFKVLSIRGWKDVLVPPSHIDAIFERQENVSWQRLSLPAAGHLVGLRDFPEEYTPVVSKFLINASTAIGAAEAFEKMKKSKLAAAKVNTKTAASSSEKTLAKKNTRKKQASKYRQARTH